MALHLPGEQVGVCWPSADEGRIYLFVLLYQSCTVGSCSTCRLVGNVSFPMLMKPLIEFKLMPWLPGNPGHSRSLAILLHIDSSLLGSHSGS